MEPIRPLFHARLRPDHDGDPGVGGANFPNAYDWTHQNAVIYDAGENSVYTSTRQLSRVTRIDYATGNIVYNMGFTMPSGDTDFGDNLFSFQHAPELHANGNMLLFDNGNRRDHVVQTPVTGVSKAVELAFTGTPPTGASIVWEWALPDYAPGLGDADRLPGGTTLVTSGRNGKLHEVDAAGTEVWRLELPANHGIYRVERIPELLIDVPGDTDGDGLADEVDNCPDHFNVLQQDCDCDGFGDVCSAALGIQWVCFEFCSDPLETLTLLGIAEGGSVDLVVSGVLISVTTTGNGRPYPPLYRNPAFFFGPYGAPNYTSCSALSTDGAGGPGRVQAGSPLTGVWVAATTGTGRGGFSFAAAPKNHRAGIRGTRVGDRSATCPYVYSYTYATLRNDAGVFGPGFGPGSFSLPYKVDANTLAKVVVKQGAAKFGGTMRMLGQLTSKSCYFRNGGCAIGSPNWRYDAIGTAASTSNGVVTRGYRATWCDGTPFECYWFPTSPPLRLSGSRFPWTTGSVTVTAVGRGPHKTVHYAKGYDNRTPTSGEGTIQLVSPTLTRWLHPSVNFETGGIGILRIRFVPEPRVWVMLIAGGSLLGVFYRWRR